MLSPSFVSENARGKVFVRWGLPLLALATAVLLYSQWGDIVTVMVGWQKTLHTMLAEHIRAVSQDAVKYGGALVALSFACGAFHAVGPGHPLF